MAILTVGQLKTFMAVGEDDPFWDDAVAKQAIQRAEDLLWMSIPATLENPPTNPYELRILKNAIAEFAQADYYISSSPRTRRALALPFQSENIGSYSYSKASKAVLSGTSTGLVWFDAVIAYFTPAGDSFFSSTSTDVFHSFDDLGVDDSNAKMARILGPMDIQRIAAGYWGARD